MSWQNKNVLVTGADGFIGSWVAKTLIEKGANTFVIIRDLKEKNALDLHELRDKLTLVQGNITNYKTIERILNEYSVDSVFHLAAQAIVRIANRSPLSTFESNIKGTWTLLEAIRNSKTVERAVVASTDHVYGDQEKVPYTEDLPLLGIYPYDASKVCTDVISRCFAKTYGVPVGVTRLANVYGGADLHMSRIIPDAICSALQNKELVIRSDGTPIRDYMYIKDAVSAYLILAENLPKYMGEAFNFGTDNPISVIDLFNLIIKLCGKNIKPKILGEAKAEIQRLYLSSERAKKLLGWEAKYSLKEGLKETIEWYKGYLNL